MLTGNAFWLLAAVFVQGGLALGLVWYLASIRVPLLAAGEVRVGDIALSRGGWPDREKQVSNAFDNQFQLPVLFYVAAFAALYLGPTWFELLLAWLFVASRLVHAFIHINDNHVTRRFGAFVAGLALLCAFWVELAVRLLVAGGGTA